MNKIKHYFNAPCLMAMVGSACATASFILGWLEKIPQYEATSGIIIGLLFVCLGNLWVISDQNRYTQQLLLETMKISAEGLKLHYRTVGISEKFVETQGKLLEEVKK